MSSVAVRVVLGLLIAAGGSGCGRDVVALDTISGHDVGRMAERQLEAENPELAPGTLSCPDLDFRVGRSVRCLRTTRLSGGRIVKVHGVIRVTSLASGGRLHVTMDARASEFGLAGDQLAAELARTWVQRFRVRPSTLECPYLRGAPGTTVTCRVVVGGVRHDTDVVVTRVDARSYRTSYTTRPHRTSDTTASQGLPTLPRPTPHGGLAL
ncbi:MAG TPA: hypothetical protein VFE07_15900 [Marmoricola sp.]|jgi:hypothetical protein|nr:hypothetical protein [Marmoricola sp.]